MLTRSGKIVDVQPFFSRREFVALSARAWASVLLSPIVASTQDNEQAVIHDPEEYVVYSVLLNSEYASPKWQQFVINVETSSRAKPSFIGFVGGLVGTGEKRPETQSDTISDFDTKNKTSFLLEWRFGLKDQYVLVTDETLKTIFVKNADGYIDGEIWKSFYKQYPGASGIYALSRVGFNAKRDEALVYIAVQRGLVGGSRRFFVLSKQKDSWAVQKQAMIWLS